MEFKHLILKIERELQNPLPGRPVQLLMSSIQRVRELFNSNHEKLAVQSSVLILLYPGIDEPQFVVTQRPTYDGIHSGQISLPGGRFETTDKDLMYTALRETEEEIGVNSQRIRIIGKLTELYIPPSNYVVFPYVGYLDEIPDFIRDPKEVEAIIEVALSKLMNADNRKERNILVRGMEILAPCYIIDDVTIWGATAMILSEFREVVGRAIDQA